MGPLLIKPAGMMLFYTGADNLKKDHGAIQAVTKLSGTKYSDEFARCCESMVVHYNFEAYKHSLQLLKRRFSMLSPDVEAQYANRIDQTLAAYRSYAASAETISQLLLESGVDQVLTHHEKAFFSLTPTHPATAGVALQFKELGATDAEISHYSGWLRAHHWDLLRVSESRTYSGMVMGLRNYVAQKEREWGTAEGRAVAVIEGADPFQAVMVGVIAVLIAVCIVFHEQLNCTMRVNVQ